MSSKKILIVLLIFSFLGLPATTLAVLNFTAIHGGILGFLLLLSLVIAYCFASLMEQKDQLIDDISSRESRARELFEKPAPSQQAEIYADEYLNTRFSEEFERAKRYQRPFSCCLVEADAFSGLINRYPNLNLDKASEVFSSFLKKKMRLVDIIIRRSPNKFLLLLPETPLSGARIAAERARFAIEKNIFDVSGINIQVTVTIAVVAFDPLIHRNREDVLAGLEKTLAEAKKSGYNRVMTLTSDEG